MKKLEENWYLVGHASAKILEGRGGFGAKLATLYYASDLNNAKRLFLAFEDLFRQSEDGDESVAVPLVAQQPLERLVFAPVHYVIYSANEASIGSGAGYWSNVDGWVDDGGGITFFTQMEKDSRVLPHSTGYDAVWVAVELTSAGVMLDYPGNEPAYRLVSFGEFDEDNHTVDSFGQSDDAFCFYSTPEELLEKFRTGEALFDDVKIASIEQIFFNHIPAQVDDKKSSKPEISKLFASLYELLNQSEDVNAELARGFVAQGQAAFEGDEASEDTPNHGMPSDGKSSALVRYWNSEQYNPTGEANAFATFQMELIDRRSSGALEVGISPEGGNIDDNLSALFEINRLPDSQDDLPCVQLHVGDTQLLMIFQRNQELILRLGDDSEKFENASIATGHEINGVPQYEQVVLIK